MSAPCLGAGNVHQTECRVASLCEHWEFHHTSVCHHVCLHICDFSMNVKLEQRLNIRFCVKLGKSGAETFQIIRRAYGNESMSRARCFEWHARFKRGRTSLEDDERSGRTSTCSKPKNVETIRRLVHEDRRRAIKDFVAIVNVSYGTVQTILTCDSNMHHVGTKFVPRLLTPEQKEHRVAFGKELRQRAVGDPSFMSRVITGDESWVYGYDPETKQVFAIEKPRIPETEEGEAEPQRDQEHANPVFRHSRECEPRICTRRPDRERRVPLQCSSPSERGHSANAT